MILDFNGLTGVDQLLQADFFRFGQEAVLPLFQQPLDLRVHLIQRLNVRCQPLRYAGIAAFVGCVLKRLQLGAGAVCQAFEGVRPVRDDLVAFLFAVRPDGNQAVQPFLRGLLVLDEILLGHTKEGETLAVSVEGLRRRAFPLVGGFLHPLERFASLLSTGHIIRNGHGGIDGRGGNGQPYGGRTAQHAQKAFDPTACLANRCGKLADAGRDAADALGHLAKEQQHWPNGGSDGRILNDLFALGFIHLKKLAQQVIRAFNQALDGGIEIISNLLSKQQRLVFEVCQLAGCGGIAFLCFRCQRGIFLPCGVGHVLRTGEQFGCIGGTEQRIAQANLVDTDVRQRLDGAFAFIVQLGQTHNKRLKCSGGVIVPQRLKLLCRHPGHLTEVIQRLAACRGGDLHFDQRLGEGGAAHLRLDAHGGKRRRKAQHLCFRKPDLLARASHAVRHFHDGLFGGGKVVAQIHQRRADIGELALAGAHDVCKLRDGRRSLVRAQVLAGIAEVNHDAGEVGQMLGSNAQLTARRHDLVDLIGSRCNLGGHALGRRRQLVKLGFGGIHGLSDRSEGRFKANGSLDCRCAQPQNGRGHHSGQRSACRRHFLADSVALFPEGFEVLARFRPCGLGRVQLLIGFFNLSAGGSDGSLGTVQRSFRVNNGIGSLPDFLRIVGLLGSCKLFFRAPQRILVLLNALLLQAELVIQQRQLGGKAGHAGVHVLDANRGQFEPALRQLDLLAESNDGGLTGINGFPGSVPVGLCQTQGLIAPVNLRLCASDRCLCCVQLGSRIGHRIRRVLSGFLQRRILAGELFDLSAGIAILRFQRVQIGLGGNGGGVVLAEGGRIRPDLLCRCSHLFLERLLCGFCVGQPLRVIVLAGKALLQLVVRCRKRPFILCYCVLLQGQAAFQR